MPPFGKIKLLIVDDSLFFRKSLERGLSKDSRIEIIGMAVDPFDAMEKIKQLNQLAEERGQTLAQMAIAWILRRPEVTTVLVGASRVSQLDNSLAALGCTGFSEDELKRIDEILA